MKEIYKDIKDYEWYYQISNFGNIRSLWREVGVWWWGYRYKKPSILNPFITWKANNKYLSVELRVEWDIKKCQLWRLVYKHFGKTRLQETEFVEYKDWNFENCNINNLSTKPFERLTIEKITTYKERLLTKFENRVLELKDELKELYLLSNK
jgi:hypothetical protein